MNWNAIWEAVRTDPGIVSVCLRLLCAMVVGLVIGTEREYTHRPAGMRTHILVALGACVVSLTGEILCKQYTALGVNTDPARLSAQVIAGIGFLGAGTILREGASVRGLTTAASLWAVGCLGIACGYGYYTVALAGMVLIFVTLTVFEVLQRRLLRNHVSRQRYVLEVTDVAKGLALINTQAQAQQVVVSNLLAERVPTGYRILFQADFFGSRAKIRSQSFLEALAADTDVSACRQTAQV